MSFFAWIALGLIAGFLASKLLRRRGDGVLFDIVLGIIGALVGGFVFQQVGSRAITGFDLWSLVVATTGALLLLIGYHTVRRVTSSHS